MKGVFVILDGVADRPNSQLDGKTPLEAAHTPNLDYFAKQGQLGSCYTVKKGFVPGSEHAILSLFGNKFTAAARGQLAARGLGLSLKRGDLALRVNFGTIDNLKSGKVIDRRAGRNLTTSEAEKLSKAINQIKLPVPFIFESSIQHRAVLVLKGGFSDRISVNDLTYSKGSGEEIKKVSRFKPLDEDENIHYTSNILNEFVEKAYEVLENHSVNIKRKEKGLLPANYLFMRGPGAHIPKLKQYLKWVALGYMPLELGFAKFSGMETFTFSYPSLKGLDAYKNLWDALRKSCKYSIKMLKRFNKKYDYAYIHIKETDLPGHDNKPLEKKQMIEYIDAKLFYFLRKINDKDLKIVVTADHSTPCSLKRHSADPVPVLFYDGYRKKENSKGTLLKKVRFCEKDSRKGALGVFEGKDLLKIVGFK